MSTALSSLDGGGRREAVVGESRRWMGSRIALDLVSSVLLVAGILKMLAVAGGPLAPNLWTVRQGTMALIALAELALGLCLLNGIQSRLAHLGAVFFFCGTLVYGSVRLSLGETICPCFGSLPTPTGLAIFISVACLILLAVARPRGVRSASRPGFWLGGGMLAAVLAAGTLPIGGATLVERVGWLDREVYAVPSRLVARFSVASAPRISWDVQLFNNGPLPRKVLGFAVSSCPCFVVDDLPVDLPAFGTAKVRVRPQPLSAERLAEVVASFQRAGETSQSAAVVMEFYLNSRDHPAVLLPIRVEVSASTEDDRGAELGEETVEQRSDVDRDASPRDGRSEGQEVARR